MLAYEPKAVNESTDLSSPDGEVETNPSSQPITSPAA
jgi:hypothetical protein